MLFFLTWISPIWAQFRRGGWAPDPETRKGEISGVVTILALALFLYLANRVLNPKEKP